MKQMKDNIYELFKIKLGGYDLKVNETLNIQRGGAGPRSMLDPPPKGWFDSNDKKVSKSKSKSISKSGVEKTTSFPKLILFNNFDYENFDKAASFDIFDYTSQNAIVYYEGRYILAKAYMQLRNTFLDDDENDTENFTYDILLMFLDHALEEVKQGFELKNLGKYIKCFYSGNTNKFSGLKKYNMFQPFPDEFGISNNTLEDFHLMIIIQIFCLFQTYLCMSI